MINRQDVNIGTKVRLLVDWYNADVGSEWRIGEQTYIPGCQLAIAEVLKNLADFEIVEEGKPMFEMKTMPWYIRVNSEAEFNAAEAWLLENYGKNLGLKYYGYMKALTNAFKDGHVPDGDVMYVGDISLETYLSSGKVKEIKLTFKTTVDKVEYPAVESKEQLEKKETIEKLERNIEEAKRQIAKLKGME